MATVARWSGHEVRALREARRMSVREFAAHLGVSDRMVSKWEAGGTSIRPRPVNQEALDTSLTRASADVKARFALATASPPAVPAGSPQPVAAAGPPDAANPRAGGPAEREAGPSGARLVGLMPRQGGSALPASAATALVVYPEDGKLMTLVDAGPFVAREGKRAMWLPGFYIDVYPTTNADYAGFVAATGHRPPSHWDGGGFPEALRLHPVVGVTWADACAYATWASKALPSGQQWEKAARGPDGARYPWGDEPAPDRCNVRESGVGATTPVDRYGTGVSPCGAYDLCGNVWEWCSTPAGAERHQIRGGAFTTPIAAAVTAASGDAPAGSSRPDIGFRCVATVETIIELLSI
jgi:formylglycine-generating enzyme required for sulfatase activity